LVDTYFGSEKHLQTYLDTPRSGIPGDGLDPPLGGRGSLKVPIFDPRGYFLLKIDRRIEQVATEYGALVGTFDKRMDEYVSCETHQSLHHQTTYKTRRLERFAKFL
jgi:hypothetical protein